MSAPIDDGGPAFPVTCSNDGIPLAISYPSEQVSGMTLRDWFAGQALAGYLASWNDGAYSNSHHAAKAAYAYADAMVAARKGGEQ